jgi:hypothetical protein
MIFVWGETISKGACGKRLPFDTFLRTKRIFTGTLWVVVGHGESPNGIGSKALHSFLHSKAPTFLQVRKVGAFSA